ncbi:MULTISPECIES: creatininase family protein [Paenibacillus]|uniref:creatininase family protein n=1 Tax=Paenibacillus TaxID=44249 RepID=UPI0022B9258A|nr:creatininase family protein [Paenibacillus caseinilyticus]MCZ8519419.1 creatininase family protein [Paenibacillus caseinilyticus]
MNPNTGGNPAAGQVKTLWSELLPYEFKERLAECPVVYLPLGLCEPHGQVSAFGLDTIKAEWLCQQAARQAGGIVAPSMGYHIHESGYHARWLEETVGEENPHMTAVPPAVFLSFFLYQLRAFVNAGFKAVVVMTGHSGGNQEDLRQAASLFMSCIPVKVWVRSDPELVEGCYTGDHAGKYELSQLMYIRPDLVNMNAKRLEEVPLSGGRLALGIDAEEASPELGKEIMEACVKRLCDEVDQMKWEGFPPDVQPRIPYSTIEKIWGEVLQHSSAWVTARPWPGQGEVSPHSQWKPYENAGTKT